MASRDRVRDRSVATVALLLVAIVLLGAATAYADSVAIVLD